MADELKLGIQLTATNGSFSQTFYPGTVSISQSTCAFHGPVVSVSTALETIPVGDVATNGLFLGRNLHATYHIIAGSATASTSTTLHSFQRIKAGEPFALRLEPGIIGKWKAVGGTAKVQMQLYND